MYYNGSGLTGDTGFSYTPGGTGLNVDGHIIPATTLLQSIGSPTYRWKDAYIGPGSLNIAGPSNASANIGVDQNNIIYAEKGFAAPFINIGPYYNLLDPAAIGGWAVYPTGTPSTIGYDLVARQKATTGGLPAALFGPEYSLLNKNRLPEVLFIPGDTISTTCTLDLTSVPASTRYVVRKDSVLNELTFTTPLSPLLETNHYVYVKNLGSSNVTVYHAPGGSNSSTIGATNSNIPTSIIYTAISSQNTTFQYIYWDGSNLSMV